MGWMKRAFVVAVCISCLPSDALGKKPNASDPVTVTIETYFAPLPEPPYDIEEAWLREINDAQSTIRITLYSFTLATVKDALINAYQRGVDVRVLVDKTAICNGSTPNALTRALAAEGIPIERYRNLQYPTDLLHDKILIIDDQVLAIGSANFTVAASRYNHENMMIIKVVDSDTRFIQAYIDQFERMWNNDFPFSGHEFISWEPSPNDCTSH